MQKARNNYKRIKERFETSRIVKNMDRNTNFSRNFGIHKAHTPSGRKRAFKSRGRTIIYLSKGAEMLEFPAVL